MPFLRPLAALGAGMFLAVSTCGAQPESPPAREPGGGDGAGDVSQGRDALRERITQRREQLRRAQERMELALKLLEDGASIERLRDEYPEFFRRPDRGGAGMNGPMGERPEGGDPFGGPPGRRPDAGPGGPEGDFGPDARERSDRRPERDRFEGPPSDDDLGSARVLLRETQPRLFQMLEELEARDPAEAKRKLSEAFPRLRPLIELKRSDPEMFELRMKDIRHGREAMDAARWLAEHGGDASDSSESDVAARRDRLRTSLLGQFDARTEIQRRELARQSARIESAKADLDKRQADRESSVTAAMDRMIQRERERIERGDPPPGHDGPPPGDGGHRPGRRGGR